MGDVEARLAALEAKVEILRRAIALLATGMPAAVAWLDESFAELMTDRVGLIASAQPSARPVPDGFGSTPEGDTSG